MAVLGAGVCGLAAAWRLLERDPGRNVVVLESETKPGGLARSLTLDGHVADLGPHRIFTELEDVQAFLKDLAGPELYEVRRASKMWLRGRWIEYPPKAMEAMQALGIGTLATAGASFAARKAGTMLGGRATGQESFESVMADAFGPQLYKLMVGQYAEKVWKVRGSELHADIAHVRVSAGGLDRMIRRLLNPNSSGPQTALQKFHYIHGGVEMLVHKLVEGVRKRGGRILTDVRVHGLTPTANGGARIAATGAGGEAIAFDAESVISTIPLRDLATMLLPHRSGSAVAKHVDDLFYIANILVAVSLKGARATDCQWLYFPGPETIFNRGYEPGNFDGGMRAEGGTLLVTEVTTHQRDALWNTPDASLVDSVVKGLAAVGLATPDRVAGTLVHRIRDTYPLYDLGYRERMGAILDWLRAFPRIVSTGRQGLFLHNNMDHSMHMGFRAAEATLATPNSAALTHYDEIRRFQTFRIVD